MIYLIVAIVFVSVMAFFGVGAAVLGYKKQESKNWLGESMRILFYICMFAVVLGCAVGQEKVYLPITDPWVEYKDPVPTFCGVPVPVLDRLIQSESSWRVRAVNKTDGEHSVGLAQVNMKWLSYFRNKYGLHDPYNPWQALAFAARYLRDLYTQTGSWYKAVLAYKCGLSNVTHAPEKIRRIAWSIAEGF